MDAILPATLLLLGATAGAALAWLFLRQQLIALREQARAAGARLEQLEAGLRLEVAGRATAEELARRIPPLEQQLQAREAQLEETRQRLTGLVARESELTTALEAERRAAAEKLQMLEDARNRLADAFKALSSEALRSNNQAFLELARTSLEGFQATARGDLELRQQAITELVRPVRESLDKVDSRIQELEKARTGAYESLTQQVRSLLETQHQLRQETTNLVRALRTPAARGRWGEIQLRRVVEMAGMLDHCDFYEQETATTDEGRLRPDLLVRLPARKHIVIDAKAPLAAYLEALEVSDDDARRGLLRDHARQVRSHVTALARKSYWDQFQPAPEFVVLFLPGEAFFSAALEHDPGLIELGVDHRVLIATPTTLIALLRAVAYGWRQESLEQNAKAISDLGRELYKRISDMGGHLSRLGKGLSSAIDAYNRAVGSLESRVLVSARRFRDLETTGTEGELEPLTPVESAARALQSPELTVPAELQVD